GAEPGNAPDPGNPSAAGTHPVRTRRQANVPRNLPHGLVVDSEYSLKPLDFASVSTYPIAERKSKVNTSMFGKPLDGSENILGFITKLPNILAGDSLRNLIRAILYAQSSGK